MSSNKPEASTSMIWFIFVTIFYFMFKLSTSETVTLQVYYSIYLLLVIIGEYFINLTLTKTICGSNQWNSALMITLFPWIVIFGMINVILNVFPGWLIPFSNTIGYGIANLCGVNELAADLFKNENIDKSVLINDLPYDESKGPLEQDFWTWPDIQNKIVDKTPDKNKYKTLDIMKEKFVDFLRLKDIVAEFIWFTISGLLVTSISYNYLLNIGCKKTVQEMQNANDDYIKNSASNKNVKDARAYIPD